MTALFAPLLLLGILEIYLPKIKINADRKQRWWTNFGFTILDIAILSILPISAFGVSLFAEQHRWGLLNAVSAPFWLQLLVTFAVISLLSYLSHFLSHKVSWLWRFHRVHHLDTHLDISTTVRVHPVEFMQRLMILVPGIVLFGVPLWALIC